MISNVILVYNAEPYLKGTLNSIFARDYVDWELLLVNDLAKG